MNNFKILALIVNFSATPVMAEKAVAQVETNAKEHESGHAHDHDKKVHRHAHHRGGQYIGNGHFKHK